MEYTDNRLPESWVETRLGKVLDYGKTRKVEPAHMQPDNWVLELEDIEKDSSKLLGKWTVRDRQPKSSKNRFAKGDVLYGKLRPYLNKVIVADEDGICTTEIIPLSGNEHIHNRYLFYWLKSSRFVQYATQASYGMNMPRLGTQDGRNAPLILPPLPEQHYIADRLDSLMARADAAQARLQGLPTQLKHYRQAVLAAAVSGDLTADWREQTGCLKEWEKTSLNQVCRWGSGGTPSRKNADYYGGDIPWIKTGDLGPRRLTQASEYITRLGLENSSAKIFPKNSVLMAMYGATIGKVSILDMEAATNQACAVGVVIEGVTTHDFLYYFLLSQKEKFIELGKGGAQPNISQTIIKNYPIALPTLPEQTEIVRRVEKLLAHADTVEQAVAHSLQQLALLKQSLLARAFSGELSAAWRAQ